MQDRRYVLDDQAGFLLRRASQRHLAIFADAIPGLTATQFAALARLAQMGPLSQNLLGRETAMDAATIKGVVGRLARAGLVQTAPDAGDRRRLIVSLTDAGHSAFEAARDRALGVSRLTLEPLEPDERRQFIEMLRRLG